MEQSAGRVACHRFEGRRVMVTGGGRGIGEAIVRRLAAEGARVFIADRDLDSAQAVAASVPGAVAHRCDVASLESVREAVAAAVAELGGLDVLVNNAYSAQEDGDFDDEGVYASWATDLDVTLTGAFRCASVAWPHLIAAEHGTIVSIGSVNGAQSFGGHAYSAAKAGLASLTRTLAAQGAEHGLRVNIVLPGTINTPVWAEQQELIGRFVPLYPLRRVGVPDDIASAVAFLASDDASWITGVELPVDGGILAINGTLRSASEGS